MQLQQFPQLCQFVLGGSLPETEQQQREFEIQDPWLQELAAHAEEDLEGVDAYELGADYEDPEADRLEMYYHIPKSVLYFCNCIEFGWA